MTCTMHLKIPSTNKLSKDPNDLLLNLIYHSIYIWTNQVQTDPKEEKPNQENILYLQQVLAEITRYMHTNNSKECD
jgi:hypothetical protein